MASTANIFTNSLWWQTTITGNPQVQVGLWVQLVNVATAEEYVSNAASDAGGWFTVSPRPPAGLYEVYTSPTQLAPGASGWTDTGRQIEVPTLVLPLLNVTDYGNDLGATIAASPSTGSVIWVPMGVVATFSQGLQLKANTTIRGIGTIQAKAGTTFSTSAIAGASETTIQDVTVDFNGANCTYQNTNYGALEYATTAGAKIKDAYFINSFYGAVVFYGSTGFRIDHATFKNISLAGASGDAIATTAGCYNGKFSFNYISNFGRQAIALSNSATYDISIVDNDVILNQNTSWNPIAAGSVVRGDISHNKVTATVAQTAAANLIDIGNVVDTTISDNTLDGGGNTFNLGGIGDAPPSHHVTITHNHISNCANGGIGFGNSPGTGNSTLNTNSICADNIIYQCGGPGIEVGDGNHVIIHDNICYDNGGNSLIQHPCGILIYGSGGANGHIDIHDNRCYDSGLGVQSYGIVLYANGGSTYLQNIYVHDNDFTGNVIAPFGADGNYPILPGQGVIFRHNIGLNPVGNLNSAGTAGLFNYELLPAVPASGVASAPTLVDSTVIITIPSGCTVSAIDIGGSALTGITLTGPTTFIYRLPAGQSITMTYSGGTPTWQYIGE